MGVVGPRCPDYRSSDTFRSKLCRTDQLCSSETPIPPSRARASECYDGALNLFCMSAKAPCIALGSSAHRDNPLV